MKKLQGLEVTTFNSGKTSYTLNGVSVIVVRRQYNDMYGNPLYYAYPIGQDVKKGAMAYKCYTSKGYYLLQSYDIRESAYNLLQSIIAIDKKVVYTEIQDWCADVLKTFKGADSDFKALCYVEEHHLKEFENGDIWIVPFNNDGKPLPLSFRG